MEEIPAKLTVKLSKQRIRQQEGFEWYPKGLKKLLSLDQK